MRGLGGDIGGARAVAQPLAEARAVEQCSSQADRGANAPLEGDGVCELAGGLVEPALELGQQSLVAVHRTDVRKAWPPEPPHPTRQLGAQSGATCRAPTRKAASAKKHRTPGKGRPSAAGHTVGGEHLEPLERLVVQSRLGEDKREARLPDATRRDVCAITARSSGTSSRSRSCSRRMRNSCPP